jgi:hypothetical protein
MGEHRNPRARLSKRPTPDNRRAALPEPEPDPDDEASCLLDVLRDNIRRADAFVTDAEEKLEQSWGFDGEEDEVLFRRGQVEYLIEAGKLAIRAANYTGAQLAAELAAQRRSA